MNADFFSFFLLADSICYENKPRDREVGTVCRWSRKRDAYGWDQTAGDVSEKMTVFI